MLLEFSYMNFFLEDLRSMRQKKKIFLMLSCIQNLSFQSLL